MAPARGAAKNGAQVHLDVRGASSWCIQARDSCFGLLFNSSWSLGEVAVLDKGKAYLVDVMNERVQAWRQPSERSLKATSRHGESRRTYDFKRAPVERSLQSFEIFKQLPLVDFAALEHTFARHAALPAGRVLSGTGAQALRPSGV